MKVYDTLQEAKQNAKSGDVIMVCNTRLPKPWAVMNDDEATKHYNNSFSPFDCIWETIK